MAFNPITDLRLDLDDKIEDSPAVNIEVELLPLLRRTSSKTKQVANVIKSNNSLLKSDLERITTLRRRLQRVIPVIPRMVGSAGAIFGQQIDREPPSGFPFLSPIIGGRRPPRPPVVEEKVTTKVPVEEKQKVKQKEKQKQKQKELDLDVSKDKTAVRERIRELIKSGALEEARKLAEEAGILSEFPELVVTDITNQKNKDLFEKLKEFMKNSKTKEKVPVEISFNGGTLRYDLNEVWADAMETTNFKGDFIDPLIFETKTYVMTDNGYGLKNVATPMYMTDKSPSPYLVLMSLEMSKEAKESGQLVEMLSESGYKINAYPDGRIAIVSPKFRHDAKNTVQNDPRLLTLFYAQMVIDLLPSKVPRGRFFTRTNLSKNVKLRTFNPPTYNKKNILKNKKINKKVLEKTLNLDKKRVNDLLKRLNTADIDPVVDSQNLTMLKVILAGKYDRSKYTKAERSMIDAFIDSTIQMINDGDIRNVKELESFLRYVQSGASPTIEEIKIDLNQLLNQFQRVNEFSGAGAPDLSSLNIDTGDNTLIVLMGNDDSPMPSFG